MTLDRARVRQYLKAFDFDGLFREELGWDTVEPIEIPVSANNRNCTLKAIAQKRGFIAYQCRPDDGQGIPDRATCNKIDRQVTDYTREHFIIYTDEAQQEQYWQWVRREKGQPVAPRGERFHVSQDGERLLQKLEALYVTWEEEDTLALSDVKKKTKQAFDVEKVTKKFYGEFKQQHGQFLGFIEGIQEQFNREWYASLMLNRLMFIYFIQRKGFLDGDPNYLQNRLQWCKENRGEDEFQTFYRYFLLKLFHEGLGSPERDAELEALLGEIPYLNGGLFEVHQLETTYPQIAIPDKAFERIFEFFDQWDWHLDDRPDKSDREINPDVLGYIFEKYINQKQMGAYYTKEDITEYISKNTIIPYLFDAAEKRCKIAFEPGQFIWRLLQENPDRYLYDAVKHGVIEPSSPNPFSPREKGDQAETILPSPSGRGAGGEGADIIPLPDEIAAGINDVSQRGGWNRLAPDAYGLPTEIWREHVARRQRCLEVREKLSRGEIHAINDLITYNLDIRQFAQDVIDNCEGPEQLRAFYKAIASVSVLDPTCGSGAFLFAALNILQPLYEACLERMQGFVDDLERSEEKPHPEKYRDFRETLEQVAKHPNREYYILKSIILNNLYGVDIMEEATEICKLRLFLKLVSQVEVNPTEENLGLEPLPDIDFNIRAGNTLVGFATLEEVRQAITQDEVKGKKAKGKSEEAAQFKLDLGDDLSRINEAAEIADRAYQMFRQMQTQEGMDGKAFTEAKREVRQRLQALNNELNTYLAKEYSIKITNEDAYLKWLKTHQPFHWFVDFFQIIREGGFDVIIGNPPYIEYSKIKKEYHLLNTKYTTLSCGNIYAPVIENCIEIMGLGSRLGMIVQLSAICTDRMLDLQNLFMSSFESAWASCYDDRPAKLFDGLEHIRATIVISKNKSSKNKSSNKQSLLTTNLLRWYSEDRESLFPRHSFGHVSSFTIPGSIPKAGDILLQSLIHKVRSLSNTIDDIHVSKSRNFVYYYRSPLYWIRSMDFLPHFSSNTSNRSVHHFKNFGLSQKKYKPVVGAIINSTLFYLWFITYGNGRNVALRDIKTFQIPESVLSEDSCRQAAVLFNSLMEDYKSNSAIKSRKDGVEYQEFYPSRSKPIMDRIDAFLGHYYGFTDEELDFIINYDIKYRMGLDTLEATEDTAA